MGPGGVLSFIKRSLLRFKMYFQDMKFFMFGTIEPVLYMEVFFYCVLYMECPLREVLMYNLC